VLLDEIAAHLVEVRREALFRVLDDLGCQAFLTGTDATVFLPLGDKAQHFSVRGAIVTLAL
jgi:DNA replication and repair protein RecF